MKLDNETKAKLDEAVAAAVGKGEHRAMRVFEAARRELPDVALDSRDLDKSLQRLRKKGIIKYESRSGWSKASDGAQ